VVLQTDTMTLLITTLDLGVDRRRLQLHLDTTGSEAGSEAGRQAGRGQFVNSLLFARFLPGMCLQLRAESVAGEAEHQKKSQ
jgi:hypothetical protein